jgi:hypothetical protein
MKIMRGVPTLHGGNKVVVHIGCGLQPFILGLMEGRWTLYGQNLTTKGFDKLITRNKSVVQ